MTSEPDGQPLLSVVAGHPTAEELAALTAVVATLATRQLAAAKSAPSPVRSAWLDRAALTRSPLHPGPDAWRRSGRPA
jgi:Acyl-CoA carboxylase epsilon subunit